MKLLGGGCWFASLSINFPSSQGKKSLHCFSLKRLSIGTTWPSVVKMYLLSDLWSGLSSSKSCNSRETCQFIWLDVEGWGKKVGPALISPKKRLLLTRVAVSRLCLPSYHCKFNLYGCVHTWTPYRITTERMKEGERSVKLCHLKWQNRKCTRACCPHWPAMFWRLLPNSTCEGYLFQLLGRLCFHCKQTAPRFE